MHAQTRTHTHTHTNPHTNTHTHTRTHIHTHARTHTHTHARTHIRMHARTHAHTHAHTYTNIHTHTHTCICAHKAHTSCQFTAQKAGFLQAGREFSSPLSTLHLHFLKGTLGVKQSTTNWAVLQECDMNRCNSTGFGQLSSFSIVCLIPIVTFCGG